MTAEGGLPVLRLPLPEGGADLEGEVAPGALGLDEDPWIRPDGPLVYRLRAEATGGGQILIRGAARLRLNARCSRCAENFSTITEDPAFFRAYACPDGLESIPFGEDVREELLVRLPQVLVCQPGCRGLCPQCGQNLNQAPCGCTGPEGDSRWSGLEGISW